MKQLEILQEYSSESYFKDNSLHVKFLETPIYYVLNFHLLENKEIIKYFDHEDDEIDLEYILKNSGLENIVILQGAISINLIANENNISFLYDILELCYEFFKMIPSLNIVDNDDGFGCPYNLFYEIKLPNESISISFLDALKIKSSKFSHLKFLDKYYEMIGYYGWQNIDKYIDLSLNEINNITVQTKVRRLGYIKMLLNMFNKSGYYPFSIFNKKVELEAKKYNDQLLGYINTKGIIDISKTGNSSKPYIEFSLALKLLYTQNNSFKISKSGKIFNVLNNKC